MTSAEATRRAHEALHDPLGSGCPWCYSDGLQSVRVAIESDVLAARVEQAEKHIAIVEPTHPIPETVPARAHYMALKTAAGYIREERDRLRREMKERTK